MSDLVPLDSWSQLRSSIAKISGRKLIGKSETDLIINNECARLLALCIIFYNACLLSKIYEYCQDTGRLDECKKIIRLSPVAWRHISLIGKYEFLSNEKVLDIDNNVEQLINHLDKVVIKPTA